MSTGPSPALSPRISMGSISPRILVNDSMQQHMPARNSNNQADLWQAKNFDSLQVTNDFARGNLAQHIKQPFKAKAIQSSAKMNIVRDTLKDINTNTKKVPGHKTLSSLNISPLLKDRILLGPRQAWTREISTSRLSDQQNLRGSLQVVSERGASKIPKIDKILSITNASVTVSRTSSPAQNFTSQIEK